MDPDPPYSVRCWVPGDSVETSGDLSSVPIILMPRLEVVKETYCFVGPGPAYKALSLLSLDQFFKILSIDDDVTWFQIDPNAIMDPDPPHRPLNELVDPDPPYSVRCWVPGNRVQTCGDLSILPIIPAPILLTPIFTLTPTSPPKIPPPPPSCGDFKTKLDCDNLGSNMGCVWNDNKNLCYKL